MKRGLAVIAVLGVLTILLSGGVTLAVSGDTGSDGDRVIVRVYYPNRAMGNKVLISFEAQLLETNTEEQYHVMRVTQDEIEILRRAGLRIEVDNEWRIERLRDSAEPFVGPAGIPGYSCYRTVEETFASAEQLVLSYPTLASWVDTGDSWEKSASLGGYDLMVLRLTNSAIPGPKPKLFLTGAMHAREYATAELVTRFGEYLVSNHGTDGDATWILDYHEVHLMLQTNPDGRKQAEVGFSWRKNTNQNYCSPTSSNRGADLNRNFAFQWGCCGGSSPYECSETYRGPSPTSEPEIQAVQSYLDSIFPDQRGPGLTDPAPDDATGIFVDVHSYGKLVLWPWGFTSQTAPNATQLQTLGRKFAYWNGHWPEQAIGLYPTDGTSDDHGYGELGVASFTFEVGTSFFQSCTYFENTLVPANMPSLVYAAKAARTPYTTPAGPDIRSLSLSAEVVLPGAPVTLSVIADDTQYNNSNGTEPTQNIDGVEYTIDLPPWSPGAVPVAMSPSDGAFDAPVEEVAATIDTTGLSEGKHILFVRGRDAHANWGAFSAIFLTVSLAQPPSVGTFEPNGGSGRIGQTQVFTTTYSDGDGHEDIAWAFLFLDRVSPVARGGLAAAYYQPTDRLWLIGGGTCQPGDPTSLSTQEVTLDCGGTTVSGVGDTLAIAWQVRPERCFDSSCGWNHAVELVTDSGGLQAAGLVGWWRLDRMSGAVQLARPGVRLTEDDLRQMGQEIKAWQPEIEERYRIAR